MVHYDIFNISYNTPLSDFLFGARRAGASICEHSTKIFGLHCFNYKNAEIPTTTINWF